MKGMTSRILVVDDERMIRWGLCRALEEAGYQVDQASHGREALEIAGRESPDMVLLDYRLPGIDGLEVLRALTAVPERPPVSGAASRLLKKANSE